MDGFSILDCLIARTLDPVVSHSTRELIEVTLGSDKGLWKWLSNLFGTLDTFSGQ